MLRERGRWRRLFGLKGHFYYYDDSVPSQSRSWSAIQWSAIIAAVSTISTAIFAYQNFKLSETTYVVAHPPKLTIKDLIAGPSQSGKDVQFLLILKNESPTTARKVMGSFSIWLNSDVNRLMPIWVYAESPDLNPQDDGSLAATWAQAPPVSARAPVLVEASVYYSNRVGESEPPEQECFSYDGVLAREADCPVYGTPKSKQPGTRSEDRTQRPGQSGLSTGGP